MIDWEDAAIGDPLADLANARLEILWAYGWDAMTTFTARYLARCSVDVTALPTINAYRCNCSICSKSGHVGMVVPRERFKLISGEDCLVEYRFDSGEANHLFCKYCGIKSFYIPRSHPDGISIHIHCLDPGTVEKTDIEKFDGQNWEHNSDTFSNEYPN